VRRPARPVLRVVDVGKSLAAWTVGWYRSDMEHYIYVSQTKLDVFLPQLPSRWRLSVDKIKVDAKFSSAEWKTPDTPLDALRIGLLSKLSDHIRNKEGCGSVKDDADFIYDIVPAKLFKYDGSSVLEDGQICFAGPVGDGGFAFFGSEQHLVGSPKAHTPRVGSALAGWTMSQKQYQALCCGWNPHDGIKVEILAKRHKTFRLGEGGPRLVTGSPFYVALA
jgi:hypothetical protein